MKLIWDYFDPASHAFMAGRTEDDKIWVEVYAYPDPADMRRWRYQVNIWNKDDYTLGQPWHTMSGRGGHKAGKAMAAKFFRENEIKR